GECGLEFGLVLLGLVDKVVLLDEMPDRAAARFGVLDELRQVVDEVGDCGDDRPDQQVEQAGHGQRAADKTISTARVRRTWALWTRKSTTGVRTMAKKAATTTHVRIRCRAMRARNPR